MNGFKKCRFKSFKFSMCFLKKCIYFPIDTKILIRIHKYLIFYIDSKPTIQLINIGKYLKHSHKLSERRHLDMKVSALLKFACLLIFLILYTSANRYVIFLCANCWIAIACFFLGFRLRKKGTLIYKITLLSVRLSVKSVYLRNAWGTT